MGSSRDRALEKYMGYAEKGCQRLACESMGCAYAFCTMCMCLEVPAEPIHSATLAQRNPDRFLA